MAVNNGIDSQQALDPSASPEFTDLTLSGSTEHGVVVGGGATALTYTAVGAATEVLTSNGAGLDPTFQAIPASGVQSVTGTADRITISGTAADPVVDIAATYVGQNTITTLGTVTTGTWNGSKVAEGYGGTNQITYAAGDILYASGVNTLAKLAAGSNTQVLTLAAGLPSWATPTAGTVESVTGTLNRITIGGTAADPTVDISTSYVGQNTITTLGTITTGTWTGTDIAVSDGGTGRSTATAYAVLCGGTTSTAAHQSIASVGTAGQLLTSNGAGALPTFQSASATNVVRQQIRSQSSAVGTTATALPSDDTIPQNTEGAEVLTVTITPTSASSVLVIEANTSMAGSATSNMTIAVFVDTTADAIAASTAVNSTAAYNQTVKITYSLSAASTSSRTYKLRYGNNTGTATINGSAGARKYGGTMYTWLSVTEYSA